ncbi:MAG: Tm-1-like ATP-binding domain-containing protein, partial [Acidimicrobiia bacterium]|nr:Tm-1-like ATP-binding domain-containing protein [Acidimicrobiia bacterium]
MANVVLLGCLDTKGEEYAYVRDRLNAAGVGTTLVNAGVLAPSAISADIENTEVAAAGGIDLQALVDANDRGAAMSAMAKGATAVLARLVAEGGVDGVMALGGTGGTSLASEAFAGLPLGLPKLIVSPAASGNTAPYVGESDLILVPSVTDVAGINRLSARIMANAAAAMAGM